VYLIPTILCGGAGSRLWPVSRELHPKPFIQLADGQSLLQKAFLRGAALACVKEVVTVTNRDLLFKSDDEIRHVNHTKIATSYVLEPFGRNTAAAIAAAALHVAKTHGDDAILLALPADHLIADETSFAEAVTRAMDLAADGNVVTFGIRPDRPETGYGYIEADGNKVTRFVEKPSLATAEEYVASGRFLWNSGMFCFAAGVMIREMEKTCPDILQAVRECLAQSRRAAGDAYSQVELDAKSFEKVREDSIDYAVMELSSSVAVVACDIEWSDVGSWNAIGSLIAADEHGNRIVGQAVLRDSTNCYIQSPDRLVGAVGINDLVIVDTPDALLVADRSRVQDVKYIYARLKAQGHETYKLHRTVHRPWGTYTVLEEGTRFKIKRIVVKPGASLSLQMHHHRSEHWVVVNGAAKVINGDNEIFLVANQSTYIPAGHKHRLENPGVIDLVMIEVQSGEYLGEDDIVRFEDRYGRQ
jgi:mannose-1-phosphate guanylyltransferase / mannose-6-phosphate isomerase